MFGGQLEIPKYKKPKHAKPPLGETDIFMTNASACGAFAHRGREPDTDYATKLLHYKQRDAELLLDQFKHGGQAAFQEKCKQLHQTKAEKRRFQAKIQNRLNQKLAEYEESIEKRREKLRVLLGDEEREEIKETVDTLQRAEENKLDDMKNRCEALRAQKETARLEMVKQKRIQQYAKRSSTLTNFLHRKHLEETKIVQLQQMRENESRREAERELDLMWEDILRRQDQAVLERETQEALEKFERQRMDKEILDMQVKAKRMLEMERKATELTDREELQKLLQIIKDKDEADLKALKEKRAKEARELREQLRMQEEFAAERKKEDQALDRVFWLISKQEMEKEQAQLSNKSTHRRVEIAKYKAHLKELEIQRKHEEHRLNEVLEQFRLEENQRTDEKACKAAALKRKLHEEVLAGRKQQLEEHKMIAEKLLKSQKEENEIYRGIVERNKKLDEESRRLAFLTVKEYRDDLRSQIEYNNSIRKRERDELEFKLQQGMEEEKQYQALVDELLHGEKWAAQQARHPFRRQLEQFDCHCPGNQKK